MNNTLDIFYQEYKKLNEKEQTTFSSLINKLIGVNYLTGEKEEDTNNYYFILNHFETFRSYFELSGMDLRLYKENKIVVLKSDNMNKLHLTRMQSAILLILRLLYHEKFHDISLSNKIVVTQLDIRDKYEQIGIQGEEKLNTTNLAKIMSLFKKYNFVNYKGQDFSLDDFSIIIYPTIQYAILSSEIEELVNKINTYKEGDDLEEISED